MSRPRRVIFVRSRILLKRRGFQRGIPQRLFWNAAEFLRD
jgi:hypothetical protein